MFIERFARDVDDRLDQTGTISGSATIGLVRIQHRHYMALLQISEPGQSPNPHQRRIAVGIDLGTTHSLVAAVRNGVAECLPDGRAG